MAESEEKSKPAVIEVPDIRTLNVLYTNDIQGEAEQMAYLATVVKNVKAESEYSLLVDAGNWAKGTMLADRFKGMPMVEIFNVLNYEAVTIGEGEITFGVSNLYQLAEKATFPMVSCNIVEEKTGIAPYFLKKFVTVEKGPFKVAITGIAAPDRYYNSGLVVKDPFTLLPSVLSEIKDYGPDIIILLSRMGIERDRALAKAFPEFNAIIGGADKKHLEAPVVVGQTFICQAGEKAQFLGSLAIDLQATIRITKTGEK